MALAHLFQSRETYRVHGAAHPASLKARRLVIQQERLRLAEERVAAKQTNLRPGSHGLGGDWATGDDPATSLPAMEWRGARVYAAGNETGYDTLAEALAGHSLIESRVPIQSSTTTRARSNPKDHPK